MFVTFIILMIGTHTCVSQSIGTIVYIPKLRYATAACTTSDTIFFVNITATPYRTSEYWNGYATLSEDFLIDKLIYSMEKCGEGFYPCEKFINITTKGREMRVVLNAKGQFWSPLWKAIHPKPNIPMLQKNTYYVTNATVDVRAIKPMIPEFEKHYWKLQIDGLTKSNAKHFCFDFHFYVLKHTIRDRRKKPKNLT